MKIVEENAWISTKTRLPPAKSSGYSSRTCLFVAEGKVDFGVLEYEHPAEVQRAFAAAQEAQQAGKATPRKAQAVLDRVDLNHPERLIPSRWIRAMGIREGGSCYFSLDEVSYWLLIPVLPKEEKG